MTEEALESGGRRAQKAVAEAGFSAQLKQRLEQRIAGAQFRSENAAALPQANLPAGTDRVARDAVATSPRTGTENGEDASFRMLKDSHKPMRTRTSTPSSRGPPPRVDTSKSSKGPSSSGTRLANARDRSSVYATTKDNGMSAAERERFRKEMKARFDPESRSVPATLEGLTSLANERIENAIARGQFKNLPRGKPMVRDHNASSPFIDTTEYFLNKIVQRQDIVPPWIEKQQELGTAVYRFRARLRNDWKRHAARLIASKGGSLSEQVKRAQEYALAEAAEAASQGSESATTTNSTGSSATEHMSQISLAGEILVNNAASLEEASQDRGITERQDAQTIVVGPPFRDPTWEQIELGYQSLAVAELNAMTRSYNLIAPKIAQKPFFTLERELRSMYTDVAPLLAQEIVDRARAPTSRVTPFGAGYAGPTKAPSLLQDFGGSKIKVYEEDVRKGYGLKEFWRDLWKG